MTGKTPGWMTSDVAQIIGCTRRNISGIRKQLIVDYSLFHDGKAESVAKRKLGHIGESKTRKRS